MTPRRLISLALIVMLGAAGTVLVLERTMPDWYARFRYPLAYESIVRGHADNYHLDAAELAAVIYVESRFRPQIRSGAGAVGLMQVLPETAQGIADRTGGEGFVEDDLYEPEINVRYGAWYLGHLRQKYRGRPNATELALAAYNAGQGTVDGWIADTPPGEPVRIGYRETRAYLDRIEEARRIYRRAYADELGY
jgi:soluble lytic murein transglycosylase